MLENGKLAHSDLNPALSSQQIQQWHDFNYSIMQINSRTPGRYDFAYVDRTGAMPSLLSVPYDPIPVPDSNFKNKSFLDVSLDRARQLLARDQPICVLWSGGLDSTLALASLVAEARYRDQIEIQCTWQSIMEAGSLFEDVVLPWNLRLRFDHTRINTLYPYSHDCGTEIYVSGFGGDQLFGKPKHSFRPEAQFSDAWYDGYSPAFLNIVEPGIHLSPRPIKTKRDLVWWMMFNFTWSTVKTDTQVMRPSHIAKRCMGFFDSADFQKWAVSTDTYHDTTPGYRIPEMQALQTLTNHQNYCTLKLKSNSITWMVDPTWYMMDTEFNNYYTDDQTQ